MAFIMLSSLTHSLLAREFSSLPTATSFDRGPSSVLQGAVLRLVGEGRG